MTFPNAFSTSLSDDGGRIRCSPPRRRLLVPSFLLTDLSPRRPPIPGFPPRASHLLDRRLTSRKPSLDRLSLSLSLSLSFTTPLHQPSSYPFLSIFNRHTTTFLFLQNSFFFLLTVRRRCPFRFRKTVPVFITHTRHSFRATSSGHTPQSRPPRFPSNFLTRHTLSKHSYPVPARGMCR